MTHDMFGCSHLHPSGQLTHTRQSDSDPNPDAGPMTVVRSKIFHYRRIYLDRPDPIVFMSLTVNTSGRLYDDFIRLLFLHAHHEVSDLANELSRNRITFDFCVLIAWLILRVLLV